MAASCQNGNARARVSARSRGWRGGIALALLARCGPSGRRSPGRQHGSFLSDGRIERRRVGVPVRGWSLAAQFLLGRLHGGDRVRGLMLGFRELLGVDLERLDLASQSVDLLCRRRVGAVDCNSSRSRPFAFDQANASAPIAPRPSATPASMNSRAIIRRRRARRAAAASSPSSSSSTSSLGISAGSNLSGIRFRRQPAFELPARFSAARRQIFATERRMMRASHPHLKPLPRAVRHASARARPSC